jgi:tripartite-type tricarboxylate transporter receptor subunit TctC
MREDRMRHRCVAAAWIAASFWAALVQAPASASAQAYPDRSVRIVIAFAAGGTIDTLGRIVAQKLSEAWGQSVFVENRPGASGNIGAAAAAQSPADGYTLHLGGQVLAVNVTLAPMKGLDPIKDFERWVIAMSAARRTSSMRFSSMRSPSGPRWRQARH